MELFKLSKFKLQLQSLISEFRDLREREHSASGQCRLLIQKQKQSEEDYERKLQQSRAELDSSAQSRLDLEKKVGYLQNDNALLQNKQNELKATIQNLLQSRDSFVNSYQESTCEMKRAIEAQDRKLGVLSEKIKSHLSLFDSIEKEAFYIKQLVDNVQSLVNEKEEIVTGLRSKMDKVFAFESVFIERILHLENKLKNDEGEFRRKDNIISELKAQLEAEEISKDLRSQIEELQKTILAKDVIIQNLISEKEALYCEVGSLSIVLQKIRETVANMDEEDKKVFSSALECQEDTNMASEEDRMEDAIHHSGEISQNKACIVSVRGVGNEVSSTFADRNSEGSPLQKTDSPDSSLEFARLSPKSASSEHQAVATGPANQ